MPGPVNLDEEWAFCLALAEQSGVPCRHLGPQDLLPEVNNLVPRAVLRNHRMIPVARKQNVITLAMADPFDVVAEDIVRFRTGCTVQRLVAPAREIEEALRGHLGLGDPVLDSILEKIPEGSDFEFLAAPEDEQKQESIEPTAPIIQLVNSIISDAIRMKASDIHVEPMDHSLRVRYRLDGLLRTIVELPGRIQPATLSRLKLISGMDITETRRPQDGRTRVRLEGREIDLRVSCLPTYHGEKIVLRILDPKTVIVDLDALGLRTADFKRLQSVLTSSHGMVLATGPTGSGKTSTLYGVLKHINLETDNLVTVENPVEYRLGGINQVQVNERAGVTFASSLRSILRQDPDVVMVGEIRDLETAEIAVQAAQTGHLVLSTLHTNDAVSTIVRLVMMGVPAYMVASSLLCVIAQRLVRRLCPVCRVQQPVAEIHSEILLASGHQPPVTDFTAAGCAECNHRGYRGRMGLFEILVISDRVRRILMTDPQEEKILEAARDEGCLSLLKDGLEKVAQGATSLDEVMRAITVRNPGGRQCSACQRTVPAEVTVCVYCGQPMRPSCPTCHHAMEPDWQICPNCQEHTPTASTAASRGGVMVLTQDPALVAEVSGILQAHNVIVASSPDEALAKVWFTKPDVVLVDLAVSELDPVQFSTALHSGLGTSTIRLIYLTQKEPSRDFPYGLEFQADGYLLKPVDPVQLLARLSP
jgi:type IV pilus assembly protein PilB